MSRVKIYHDTFYAETFFPMDAASNSFAKIEKMVASLKPGAMVLDIGCGAGSVSSELVKRGFRVDGLDIQEGAVIAAQAKGLNASVFDFQNAPLPYEESRYGCVLLLDVLEHLYDPLFTLVEAKRVLSIQGMIVISLPLHFDIIQRLRILFGKGIVSYDNFVYGREVADKVKPYNYDHIRFFTIEQARSFVKDAGLVIERESFEPTSLVLALRSRNFLVRALSKALFNRLTCQLVPGFFASSIQLVARKK